MHNVPDGRHRRFSDVVTDSITTTTGTSKATLSMSDFKCIYARSCTNTSIAIYTACQYDAKSELYKRTMCRAGEGMKKQEQERKMLHLV
jgi:hypothetical protein